MMQSIGSYLVTVTQDTASIIEDHVSQELDRMAECFEHNLRSRLSELSPLIKVSIE
jgi:hypothetical protein